MADCPPILATCRTTQKHQVTRCRHCTVDTHTVVLLMWTQFRRELYWSKYDMCCGGFLQYIRVFPRIIIIICAIRTVKSVAIASQTSKYFRCYAYSCPSCSRRKSFICSLYTRIHLGLVPQSISPPMAGHESGSSLLSGTRWASQMAEK